MARQIFIVNATIVDSTGAFHVLDGYPMSFDSNSYEGDSEKARRRAEGEFSDCWSKMCKRDDRMIQTVTLTNINGFQLDAKSYGTFMEE